MSEKEKLMKKPIHTMPFVVILGSAVLLMLASRYLLGESSVVDLIAITLPIVIVGPVYFFLGKKRDWGLSLGSVLLTVLLMAALVGVASYLITVR